MPIYAKKIGYTHTLPKYAKILQNAKYAAIAYLCKTGINMSTWVEKTEKLC